jgi:hypothetical protein
MATIARAPIAALPDVGMSQSGLMVAALIGGFVVWLMMNGKLATYWSILLGGSSSTTAPAAAPSGGTTGSGGSTLPSPGSSGAPIIPSPIPGNPGLALPPNPLPTPSPGTGFGGFN